MDAHAQPDPHAHAHPCAANADPAAVMDGVDRPAERDRGPRDRPADGDDGAPYSHDGASHGHDRRLQFERQCRF
jgi:hypothetical protein